MASLPDGSKPDYEKYTYCTVEMEYVPADKITDDETYYEVETEAVSYTHLRRRQCS